MQSRKRREGYASSLFENCYLFFLIKRFNYSLKAQSASPKKVYAIDTGMAHAIGFRASQDTGRMLENIVFIELKRRGYEIYYHREKKECDFVACKQNHIKQLIQVCYDLSDDETKQREIAGLVEAMTIYQLKQGWIINLTESDNIEIKINNKLHHIEIISIWAWIVSKNDGL